MLHAIASCVISDGMAHIRGCHLLDRYHSLLKDLTCRETLRLFAYLKGGILTQQGESLDTAVEKGVQRRLDDVKFASEEDADKKIGRRGER